MKVKKVSINELEKLAPLYGKITPALTSERREKIEDRIIDIFVIEEHNEFLAEITVVYEYTTHANFTIPNQRIYFEALRVHPKHQNKGLAQMLMKKVIENLYYV
ncbi:MAG: GNAT family N-acetyltransferase [Candidatus Peribacteria bacterium]|jgi:GNAT superfamily N-acetyltransferase|nr:GNAT family N-acetyltransferase [Candidatus Peribacteria bacterium]